MGTSGGNVSMVPYSAQVYLLICGIYVDFEDYALMEDFNQNGTFVLTESKKSLRNFDI